MQRKFDDWFSRTPQDIPPKVQLVNGKVPKLKVACVAIGEVGHFIPVSHIADALVQRGHEVHFITNQDYNTREKAKIILNPIGVKVHFTNDKVNRAELLEGKMHKFYDFPHNTIQQKWMSPVYDVIQDINPDIVVSDFWCIPGTQAADKLNIPSVINFPAPFSMPEQMGFLDMPNMSESFNFFGFVCLRRSFSSLFANLLCQLQLQGSYGLQDYISSFSSRVILSNSFFGLEQPRCFQPNVFMTGPLVRPQTNLLQILKERHNDLFNWLEEASRMKKPVLYISIGSYCLYQDWSIEALYYGLKKLGCRVIWSLKKQFKLPKDNDPDFWVSPWVPQVELLSHPAVKAGITHCGWGGTMEFIAAGVPVIGWPHFFDQFKNASLICEENKAGRILLSRMRYTPNNDEHFSYISPEFDADYVYQICKDVLVDRHDFYKHNMVRLQRLSERQNGRDVAVKTVEQVAVHGSKHLVDVDLQKHREGINYFSQFFFFLLIIGVIIGNLHFGMIYHKIEVDQYVYGEQTAQSVWETFNLNGSQLSK